MEDSRKPLHEEIMDLLVKRAILEKQRHDYINPHFLSEISGSLYQYYDLENDDVQEYISGMYDA